MKGVDMMTEEQKRLNELTGNIKTETEAKKGEVVQAAQHLKEQVQSVGQDVKERTQSVIEEGKGRLTSSLDGIALTLGQTSEGLQSNELGQLAPYGERLQDWTQGLSDYLKTAKPADLLHDVEKLARRQPALFLGGAFVVGLATARFLKSSAARSEARYASTNDVGGEMRYE
jgi:pyridoxal biosynthesis lyase PdxS